MFDAAIKHIRSITMTLTAIALTAIAIKDVHAQGGLRIAAIVNDEMISVLDVESRLTLSIYLSKLDNNLKTRSRLAPQILRNIIDDRLKLQEIRRNKIKVSRAEVLGGLRQWERRAGLSKGATSSLTQRLGIDKAAIAERVEIGVGWRKLMQKLFLPTVSFSEQEIDDIVSEEISKRGQPEFLVSEIFLPLSRNSNMAEVRALARRLIEQMAGGAEFGAIAHNFSQSASAAVGGKLGWIRQKNLSAELSQAIEQLHPGEVSQPIPTLDGFYILKVENKRSIEPLIKRSNRPEAVVIHQIHLKLPPSPTPDIKASFREKARGIGAQARSCKDMEDQGKKHGSSLSGSPGKIEVDKLSPLIQKAISGLKKNQTSTPLEIANGFLIIMVCERDEPQIKKFTKAQLGEKIRNQLGTERIKLAARQYLRSLRRSAIVDIRL